MCAYSLRYRSKLPRKSGIKGSDLRIELKCTKKIEACKLKCSLRVSNQLLTTRQMIIIVGASVSDMVMVIIIHRFLKCVVRGASVHVARRQLTLGAHSSYPTLPHRLNGAIQPIHISENSINCGFSVIDLWPWENLTRSCGN